MRLSYVERVALDELLPQRGGLMQLQLAKDIREKTRLTADEMSAVDWKDLGPGQVWWDDKKEPRPKEFSFTNAELRLMKDQVEQKDRAREIPKHALSLCLKIKDAETEEEPKKTIPKTRKKK